MPGQNKVQPQQYALRAEEDPCGKVRAREEPPVLLLGEGSEGRIANKAQNQHLLDLPKVIAVGIASPAGAALTSRFGVAGTLIGLAVSAVVVTVITDILKVYLARVPGTVTKIPGGFRKKSRWQNLLYRIRQPFSKFSSLPPLRRRSILIGSLVAGGISFLVGIIIVTGLELSVGKNLSCWVWNECPKVSSTSGKGASTGTMPSIFGGSQSASSGSPQVAPSNPQQQPSPDVPQSPSQTPNVPGPEEKPAPDQQGSPSGEPAQQQSPSGGPGNQQQGKNQGSTPPVSYEG